MHRSILAAAAAIALLPLAALAQSTAPQSADPQDGRGKMRAACAADIQKFCADIERAKGAMRSCLEAHENDLTASCKAARAERAAERAKTKS
jgi:predicted outer membrane protein